MVDHLGRRIKDTLLDPLLRVLPGWVHPNGVTLLSLLPGVATAILAAFGYWHWAIFAFALNRILDGLDGLLARGRGLQSDFGGYLDIMIDFLVYAVIPIGVWLGVEGPLLSSPIPGAGAVVFAETAWLRTLAPITLLAVFYVNGASWMYLSSLLEKRRASGTIRDESPAASRSTSIQMPAGLVEGTETVLFYLLFLLFPSYYPLLFYLMAAATAVGVVQRLAWAWDRLR